MTKTVAVCLNPSWSNNVEFNQKAQNFSAHTGLENLTKVKA